MESLLALFNVDPTSKSVKSLKYFIVTLVNPIIFSPRSVYTITTATMGLKKASILKKVFVNRRQIQEMILFKCMLWKFS